MIRPNRLLCVSSALLIGAIALCSCKTANSSRTLGSGTAVADAQAGSAAIYSRSNTWFTNVVIWKPVENDAATATDPASKLANVFLPLIVQELADTNTHAHGTSPLIAVGIQNMRASVAAANIGGQPRMQVAYRWTMASSVGPGAAVKHHEIRITIGSDGLPAFWEVRGDASRPQEVYAAQAVELKAAAAFKGSLPGRMFSLEPATNSIPSVVVPRVLQDGPVPMGPIIFVNQHGEIATLICRCMPSPAGKAVEVRLYEMAVEPDNGSGTPNAQSAVNFLRLPPAW